MTTGTISRKTPSSKPAAHSSKPRQATLTPNGGVKKPTPTFNTGGSGSSSGSARVRPKPNASILNFFQKTSQSNGLFLAERNARPSGQHHEQSGLAMDDVGWEGSSEYLELEGEDDSAEPRFNELEGSLKRRRLSEDGGVGQVSVASNIQSTHNDCTPPPPPPPPPSTLPLQLSMATTESDKSYKDELDFLRNTEAVSSTGTKAEPGTVRKRIGPFLDDSESEDEEVQAGGGRTSQGPSDTHMDGSNERDVTDQLTLLKQDTYSYADADGFDAFEDMGDFDEDLEGGEEFNERLWAEKEQEMLEKAEREFNEEMDEIEGSSSLIEGGALVLDSRLNTPSCPICNMSLSGVSDQEATVHVNNCLDGNPSPIPNKTPKSISSPGLTIIEQSKRFQRPPKAGQASPFALNGAVPRTASAFSKLMAGNAEDTAWASAAAAETAARGKPSYQRTCPFYKILPGFSICVDAFRYGAVKDCQAYFLSHFHSDHYIGLTSSWSHGPIYCSKITANLVRQQLRVNPKWVIALEFEQKVEVPGTGGAQVTMIPANHCPGSSLFLFEKKMGKGPNPRIQRILHCGDFRACRAHIEHPLLRPDVIDGMGQKIGQQKIDICYLDTTYLNPKYSFPNQDEVIQACAEMCVSLNKEQPDEADDWEQMKISRAGKTMAEFVRKESVSAKGDKDEPDILDDTNTLTTSPSTLGKTRGRLLVVVGTYSIGKERICMGIAQALNSKIYAPSAKRRICACLEDPELNARLTDNPHEAQVHMTPLFEIRPDTLDDYLKEHLSHFSRIVGFRPSGWNYRPPNSRFVDNPSVQTVLHSPNWKTAYTMKELVPQRGSTTRASCFGVPYSEHSSFRELTMFCCALRIDKIIPTVNVGNAKSREKMKAWCEKWAIEKKKNGLFKPPEGTRW